MDIHSSYTFAIIGAKEAVLGFKMLGVDIYPCNDKKETVNILYDIINKQKAQLANKENFKPYAVIFVMEELAEMIPKDDYKKLTKDPFPVIIPIPSHKGTNKFGLKRLSSIVERAIGSDILNIK